MVDRIIKALAVSIFLVIGLSYLPWGKLIPDHTLPWLNLPVWIAMIIWLLLGFIFYSITTWHLAKSPENTFLKSLNKISGAFMAWAIYAIWLYFSFEAVPHLLKPYFKIFSIEALRFLGVFIFPLSTIMVYFSVQQYYPEVYGAKKVIAAGVVLGVLINGALFVSSKFYPVLFHGDKSDIWYDEQAFQLGEDYPIYRMTFTEPLEGEVYRCRTTGNVLTHLSFNSPDLLKKDIRERLSWKFRIPFLSFGQKLPEKDITVRWELKDSVSLDPGTMRSGNYMFKPGDEITIRVISGKVDLVNGIDEALMIGDRYQTIAKNQGVLGFKERTGKEAAEVQVLLRIKN